MTKETVVKRVDDDHYVAVNDDQRTIGMATREGPGQPWNVEKIQWRGANGNGRVAGHSGGGLLIGTVWPNGSQLVQVGLVNAMLKTL